MCNVQDMDAYLSQPIPGEGRADPVSGSVVGVNRKLFVECKQRGIGVAGSFVFNTRLAQHSGTLHRNPSPCKMRDKQVCVVKRNCIPSVNKSILSPGLLRSRRSCSTLHQPSHMACRRCLRGFHRSHRHGDDGCGGPSLARPHDQLAGGRPQCHERPSHPRAVSHTHSHARLLLATPTCMFFTGFATTSAHKRPFGTFCSVKLY